MGSVIYRDRERERLDDTRTSVSSSRRGDRDGRDGGYTTVKRYVVKAEDDSRSSYGRDRGGRDRGTERIEETRIVTRERDEERPRREEPRYAERDLVIRRDREEEPRYERRREEPAERELVIRRTTTEERGREERDTAISRYDDRREFRDYEVISPGSRDVGDRELQKYVRTNEFYGPAPQPQTIIIRNEPIIIRERVRDEDYQIVRKSDVEEERSVVRREPDRPDRPDRGREEEFFYEKKVKERQVDPPPRRRDEQEDDYYERKSMRREVSPHDSVSQVGTRRDRERDDYSDDSMVYVRKEVREDEGYDREQSPHHRRHIAEGAIAGAGVAELLRNHRGKEGREVSGGVGRVGRDVGGAALGALAAEGISRARSWHRSKSRRRDRSRSDSRETRRDRRRGSRGRDRDRDRSDSESPSNLEKYGKLGLGAAALAAAAAFAAKKLSDNKDDAAPVGRSRSRRRRGDATSINDPDADDARNPSHRNKIMAGAGLAGAAVAGLIERQRSKSRGPREPSQTRVRQGLPIVAAGLASAGAAALYERNKAKTEADAAAKEERRSRARSRSRSKSRSRNDANQFYDGPRGATASDPGLIEYGTGAMYGNNFGPDYYGRPAPQEAYYPDQNAMLPAAAAAAGTAGYVGAREARSRSRSLSRDRRRDAESADEEGEGGGRRRRHRKHRSQSRELESAGVGAAGGALAAGEYERRKQEKRDRKARRRQEEEHGHDPYEEGYNPQQQQPYTPTPPPIAPNPYAAQPGYYPPPPTNQFPPPPGATPAPYQERNPSAASGYYAPGQSYPANEFPPPPGSMPPPPAQQYPENYVGGVSHDPYAQRGRGGPENVSLGTSFSNQNPIVDGLNPPYQPPHLPPMPVPSGPANPPPIINIQRPSESESETVDPYAHSSMPNTASERRKSVQFAASPREREVTSESDVPRPGLRRVNTPAVSRGYEASEDTDSPDDRRRAAFSRSQPNGIDDAGDRRKHKHHRRQRSHDPSAPASASNSKQQDYLSTQDPADRLTSPLPSDIEVLPDRFDEEGRRVPEPDESRQDYLDRIMAGEGLSGRVFGNLANGLFGPEGRRRR